jgi:CHAD domain-containing protein
MARKAPPATRASEGRGLGHWMRRVLRELDRVGERLDPEPVHKLRVALRQSRSLVDVLSEIDPDPSWSDVKKAAKKLFQRLGDLRDGQVMGAWLETLAKGRKKNALVRELLDDLERREKKLKARARRAAGSFDRSAWKQWLARFAARNRGRAPSVEAFRYVALVRWRDAKRLHAKAVRGAPRETWHELRIALKRFRYVVESFLADSFSRWVDDLKRLQDLLGEIHDLDVLQDLVIQKTSSHAGSRSNLLVRIDEARASREAEYRDRTRSRPSLWAAWRRELPPEHSLRDAALAQLEAWARRLTPGFERTARLRGAALEVLDALARAGIAIARDDSRQRTIVEAAALLQGIGAERSRNGVEPDAWKMVRSLEPPLGWTSDDVQAVACALREEPRVAAGKKIRMEGLPAGVAREARATAVLLSVARTLARNDVDVSRVTVTTEGDLLRFDVLDPEDGRVLASATAPRAELETEAEKTEKRRSEEEFTTEARRGREDGKKGP